MDGLGGSTTASSDEPGRRRQHDELRIRADIAVRGIARPGKKASARGSGGKAARAPTGRNEANAPSPATGGACAEAVAKQAGGSGDRSGVA